MVTVTVLRREILKYGSCIRMQAAYFNPLVTDPRYLACMAKNFDFKKEEDIEIFLSR